MARRHEDARHPHPRPADQARAPGCHHDTARHRLPLRAHMRRRLVLAIAGIAALAVLLFAVPLALVIKRTYRDEALMRLQRDTVAATRSIDVTAGGRDPVEIPRGAGPLAVYDRFGQRVAGDGPAGADGVVGDALRTGRPAARATGGRLLVAVPLMASERVTGAVRIQRDDTAVTGEARDAWL